MLHYLASVGKSDIKSNFVSQQTLPGSPHKRNCGTQNVWLKITDREATISDFEFAQGMISRGWCYHRKLMLFFCCWNVITFGETQSLGLETWLGTSVLTWDIHWDLSARTYVGLEEQWRKTSLKSKFSSWQLYSNLYIYIYIYLTHLNVINT